MLKTTLMVQGTSSDAGKSMLVAGLCRCLTRAGFRVVPFKPQNMALNSAVTADGGEIGRAQALQAQAAGVELTVDMNPVLLKPSSDTGAQVIIQGKAIGDMHAQSYHQYKTIAMDAVMDSYKRLKQNFDVVVVEGAGSPAEINLRDRDIANMGFAENADCPVVLIADIDRGGVFAQLVGTLDLLSPSEQNRIVGFVINKFRGDIALLTSGLEWLEEKTGKPVFGVLPYIPNLQLAAEDAISTEQVVDNIETALKIAVPVFSRISNHTDFDLLRTLPEVDLVFVGPYSDIPPCDLIILPGSKNVRGDLVMLEEMGWKQSIFRHLRYGGKLLGICGGYQMLGHSVKDPEGVEDVAGESAGMGLLNVSTILTQQKQLTNNQGFLQLAANKVQIKIKGFQIHVGETSYEGDVQPFAILENDELDGAISDDGQIAGTYLHGLFDDIEALTHILAWAGKEVLVKQDYQTLQENELNRLADVCETHLEIEKINLAVRNFYSDK